AGRCGGAGRAPAVSRPADDGQEEAGDALAEYVHTPDPNPAPQAGPDDPIDETGYDDWTFDPPPDAAAFTKDQADAALSGQLAAWVAEGKDHFTSKDLRPLLDRIGRSRQWAQKQYKTLITDGVIGGYDETTDALPLP